MTKKPDLKTTAGKIEDLDQRVTESLNPLGEGAVDGGQEAGQLTARTRIDALLDAGSFVETDALARHRSVDFDREHNKPSTDGVVTGYGTLDGRKVCVFSQDESIFEGTLGEVNGEKIIKIYDLALKTGVPIVGIHASAGPRVQEGIVTLGVYGRIMARATAASGLIPQVSIVVGDTEGLASFLTGFSDLVVMTTKAALHQARPSVVAQVFGEDVTAAELGGAGVHSENGTAQIIAETDELALLMARDALGYLPVNNRAEAPRTEAEIMSGSIADNISETDKKLLDIIPDEASTAYDMREVVDNVVDDASFYEVSGAFAPNVLTGFARIEGHSVGVVANQPMANAGALDSAAAEKAARFIRTCDAFNTPVVTFVDSPGFVPSLEEEKAGLVRRATKLAYAYAEASVGKITVITRKALGPAFVFMGSKDLGADLAYGWPTSEIAVAQTSQAAEDIYGADATEEQKAELEEKFMGPYQAAERGMVDAVISPAATRGHLIEGLRLLERKVVPAALKKHGNITL